MILNTSALAAIFRSFSAIYAQAVEAMQGKPLYQRITTVVPSSAKGNDYGWLGNFPSMREWIGEKIIKNLKAFKYSIENKDWESTISVDRNDILDDSVGIYEPLVKGLASAAEMHPDELIFGLLPAGFAAGGECYDGQFMFDSDHPVGDTTVSNVGTEILNRSNFAAARTGMMSLTDDTGRFLNIRPDLLVVPPQLESAALEIVGVAKLANGQDNIYYKTVEVLVVPALAGNPTKWYLFDTTKPVKPFVFQRRSPNKLVSLTNDADQNVFMKKEFLYSVEARDNAGYGMWQCAYGSTGTT